MTYDPKAALIDAYTALSELEQSSYWQKAKSVSTTHLYKADEALHKVISKLTPDVPLPVPASGIIFGHCKAINNGTQSFTQREFLEMSNGGGNCPRIDYWANGTQGVTIPLAKAQGFPHLLLCVGATLRSVPNSSQYASLVVQAADENPNAFIEYANEPGINGWTAADCVRVWNAATKALRDSGYNNKTLMGAISGSERPNFGRAGARQWCKELKAEGFQIGVTCDWPNYHVYGDLTREEQNWINYWTPTSYNGESCNTILGATEFAVTEFGSPIGSSSGNTTADKERSSEAQITNNMEILKATPGCRVATVYALSDIVGGTSSGYGLCRTDWGHRPSWGAFRDVATGLA